MDYQTEFNPDLASTLKAAISGMWGEAHIAARLPSPPVLTALESENYQSPVEPLSNGCDGFTTLETVPYNFDQTSPSFTDGFMDQAAPFAYQEPVFGENGMWSVCPRSPFGVYNQAQYNNVIPPPDYENQSFRPIGYLNGDEMYDYPPNVCTHHDIASPSLDLDLTKKRKRSNQQDSSREYVKRPPNAFMIFRKEQRPHVVAETNITDCAAVNKILGQRWKMMTRKQQAKYYEEAKRERAIHAQLYPDWSAKDNYGNMPKRVRRKTPTSVKNEAY